MAHKIGEYGGQERSTEAERKRLRYLAQGLNPSTQRWIREIGIAPGWTCLEIGAAEGSMTRWLAEQVGSEGRVVAADIDIRFLDEMDVDNVEVRQLDVRTDPLERDAYELVYCRTLLLHLPDPRAALARMADALVPGGVLFAQEPDMCLCTAADPDHPDAELFESFHRRMYAHLREIRRFDTRLGRTLPALLESVGLQHVRGQGVAEMIQGAGPTAQMTTINLKEVFGPMVLSAGIATREEIDTVLRRYADPGFSWLSGLQFAVWGRR